MSKGAMAKMQPSLFHIEVTKDSVNTPDWLAEDMVNYFLGPNMLLFLYKDMGEKLMDPSCGLDGVFLKYLPARTRWCEIKLGVDFYAFAGPIDWLISNPPYSHLLAWIRHSMYVAENFVYLIPLHRVWASNEFLDDLDQWGGVKQIRRYGTGTQCGFPFGHAVAVVHFQKDYDGPIYKSKYSRPAEGI